MKSVRWLRTGPFTSTTMVIIMVALVLSLVSSSSPKELIDKVVAIVGRSVITLSELEAEVNFATMTLGTELSVAQEDSLRRATLQRMVENKILMEEALRDTTIHVESHEVDDALNRSLTRLRAQFPSDSAFQAELAREGETEASLKVRHRKAMRNELLAQKLVEARLRSQVMISDLEIENFYHQNRDSLPIEPEQVKLAHILVRISPSLEEERRLQTVLNNVMDGLRSGKAWTDLSPYFTYNPALLEMAKESAFVRWDDMLPEVMEMVRGIQDGGIDTVRSQRGFHLVQVDRSGPEGVWLHHLLLPFRFSPEDSLRARNRAEKLRRSIAEGEPFAEVARNWSDDPVTRPDGGDLGMLPVELLNPEFLEAVDSLNPGEVSGVLSSEHGYHLVQLVERKEATIPSLEDVRDQIREFLVSQKMEEAYYQWMEELRQRIFVSNLLEAEANM